MSSAVEVPSSFTVTEATDNPPIAVSRGGFSLAGLKFDTNICAVARGAKKRTAETTNREKTDPFMDYPPVLLWTLSPSIARTPLPGDRCTQPVRLQLIRRPPSCGPGTQADGRVKPLRQLRFLNRCRANASASPGNNQFTPAPSRSRREGGRTGYAICS